MKKYILSVVAGLLPISAGWAAGVRVPDLDARAIGRGDAFTATADNPSAIIYNPAGITQLDGFQARLGLYLITVDAEYHSQLTGKGTSNDSNLSGIPNLYLTYKPKDSNFAFGLGYYVPFGLSISYPSDSPFATQAQGARIQYHTLNPVVAWEPVKGLSFAAGLTVDYAEAAQRFKTPGVNGEFKLEGSGVDVGYNFGILWQPTPQHSFGFQYHSKTSQTLRGHSLVDTDAATVATPLGPFQVPAMHMEHDVDATFHFPQFLTFGYSFRPTPKWNFEADIDWTDWNDLNTLHIHQQGAAQLKELFDWSNSLAFEFGVTRELPYGLRLSAGYIYSEHAVPENRFDPIVPDGRRHIFCCGVGQTIGRFNWDVAYQYAYQPSRSISNSATGNLIDGDYRLRANAVAISIGYAF